MFEVSALLSKWGLFLLVLPGFGGGVEENSVTGFAETRDLHITPMKFPIDNSKVSNGLEDHSRKMSEKDKNQVDG